MLEKYRATIHGNTIEWNGESPKDLTKNTSIVVDVTVVGPKPKLKKPNRKKMAEALEKLAGLGGVKSIPDPDKWLREIRTDRPLPGR